MLNKREITVKIGKKEPKDGEEEVTVDTRTLKEKVQEIADVLEPYVAKGCVLFAGYMLLDTYRRVQIAKAENPQR